jgi:hypothetical protein
MTFVYIISTVSAAGPCGPVKIGIANDPAARIATLRTASPNRIQVSIVFGPMDRAEAARAESLSHKELRRVHRHGEWFDIDPIHAIRLVADAVSLVCIGRVDNETYAKRSSQLGVAAAQMLQEPR